MLSTSFAASLVGKYCPNTKAAYGLFGGFLASIFFFRGALSTSVSAVCFVTSWILIIRDVRRGKLPTPLVEPIVMAFLIVVGLRLLLPPYGIPGAIPGAAESRVLLLLGLYGLVLFVHSRLPFSHILWLLAGAAFLSVMITLATAPQYAGRLALIGRSPNQILGAGAAAAGFLAAITLFAHHGSIRQKPLKTVLLAVMIGCILAGIYLTGSRGPFLAIAFALCMTPFVITNGSQTLLFTAVFGTYVLVTASVLLEGPIRHALCPAIELACRDPSRYEVWKHSIDIITQHPLWGVGYAFRFEGVPHAHNTYLGMALHYGIPLAIFFICVMTVALFRVSRLKKGDEKFFIVATLIFANGFMGSDLSDPVRFFNTHYVFLWLPIFFAFMPPRVAQQT